MFAVRARVGLRKGLDKDEKGAVEFQAFDSEDVYAKVSILDDGIRGVRVYRIPGSDVMDLYQGLKAILLHWGYSEPITSLSPPKKVN